jgi:hypothetical protein
VIDFLQAGYLGFCARRLSQATIDDAILLRAHAIDPENRALFDLPQQIEGMITELIEVNEGQERRLALHIDGQIVYQMLGLLGAKPAAIRFRVGPELDMVGVQAWVQGIPSDQITWSTGPAPVSGLLEQLRAIMDRPDFARGAAYAWRSVARRGLQSSSRDEALVQIEQLMAERDPWRVNTALDTLYDIKLEDRKRVLPRLFELVLEPSSFARGSPITRDLADLLYAMGEAAPPEIRARAKTRLAAQSDIGEDERKILFLLLVQGGDAMRLDAVQTVFALQGFAFEDTVGAIDKVSDRSWIRDHGGWRLDELQHLVDRADDVPDERFVKYINSIRFSSAAIRALSDIQDRILKLSRNRLAKIEESSTRDEGTIKSIKELIERMPTSAL